jgi:hypothetical protein
VVVAVLWIMQAGVGVVPVAIFVVVGLIVLGGMRR